MANLSDSNSRSNDSIRELRERRALMARALAGQWEAMLQAQTVAENAEQTAESLRPVLERLESEAARLREIIQTAESNAKNAREDAKRIASEARPVFDAFRRFDALAERAGMPSLFTAPDVLCPRVPADGLSGMGFAREDFAGDFAQVMAAAQTAH